MILLKPEENPEIPALLYCLFACIHAIKPMKRNQRPPAVKIGHDPPFS
jgi:hypothetical protein